MGGEILSPQGLGCPGCGAPREQAREFRRTSAALSIIAATTASGPITSIPGPSLRGVTWTPRRVVLLVRGVCKGEPATVLAEELALSRQCVHRWRKRLQANGYAMLSSAGVAGSRDGNR